MSSPWPSPSPRAWARPVLEPEPESEPVEAAEVTTAVGDSGALCDTYIRRVCHKAVGC
jgi:hypothetical protein